MSVQVSSRRAVLAVSLGERRVRVAVLDGHLSITAGVSIDLQDLGSLAETVVPAVLETARQVLDGQVPTAVAVAGTDHGSEVHDAVAARLAAAYDEAPTATLPAVRAMALGERRAGAARGVDDFVAVRLGSSVTAATVAGGRVARGVAGHAGEIGHLRVEEFGPACGCGLTGCLDAFVGAPALVSAAAELARRGRSPVLQEVLDRSGALDLSDLVAAGRGGDPVVVQLARELGQRLGRVVAGLVAQSNPQAVVLGGPVAALGPHLLGDLRATVYRVAPARQAEGLQVVLSELGEQAVLVGTGSAALDAWLDACR